MPNLFNLKRKLMNLWQQGIEIIINVHLFRRLTNDILGVSASPIIGFTTCCRTHLVRVHHEKNDITKYKSPLWSSVKLTSLMLR